ncbi:MAG: hypothetical protein QM813_01185 [Verrucomicrobiota bacterium]
MNDSTSTNSTPAEPLDTSIPLDLKFFYGFVVVLVLSAIALIVIYRPKAPPTAGWQTPNPPRQLSAFTLTNQMGRVVSREEFSGKYLVVNFVQHQLLDFLPASES